MTSTQPHRTTPGRARLYQMSAERALAAIPAGSISVLVTDPPYTSVNRRGGATAHLQHWFPGGLSWTEIGRILAVARRKLRTDGIAFVMVNGDGLHDALGALQRAGFARVRTIHLGSPVPRPGGRPPAPDGVRAGGPAPRLAHAHGRRFRLGSRGRPGDGRPLSDPEA